MGVGVIFCFGGGDCGCLGVDGCCLGGGGGGGDDGGVGVVEGIFFLFWIIIFLLSVIDISCFVIWEILCDLIFILVFFVVGGFVGNVLNNCLVFVFFLDLLYFWSVVVCDIVFFWYWNCCIDL